MKKYLKCNFCKGDEYGGHEHNCFILTGSMTNQQQEQEDWREAIELAERIVMRYANTTGREDKYRPFVRDAAVFVLTDALPKLLERAKAEERENCINQPANQHDERIRAAERKKVQREMYAVHIVDLYEIRYPLIRSLKYHELQNLNELIQKNQLDSIIAQLIDKYDISLDDIKDEIYKRSFSTPQEGDNK